MKTPHECRVLSAIQHDLLRELLHNKEHILRVMKDVVSRSEFHAAKYKDRETYEQLLVDKKAYNILKTFIEVMSHENPDCS